jgi:hypothetical protein
MPLTENDRLAIRSVIEQQIIAFQQEDAKVAFSFASLGIKYKFKTADDFMKMVKSSYPAVYCPRSVLFDELMMIEGQPAQMVWLLNTLGNLIKAIYLMEKQPDGSWKIDGCFLVDK